MGPAISFAHCLHRLHHLRRWLRTGIALLLGTGLLPFAAAGTLGRAEVQAMFPPPLLVGEKLAHVPVWPIFRRAGATPEIQSYVFETVDLEPVAGYGGKPLNLLVVMDRDGHFVQTRLLAHAEPIFRSAQGTAVLQTFAAQYQGLSVQHEVQVLTPKAQRQVTPTRATLHGIVAGTVTALAIDRSLMESAAQVAQAVAQAAAQGAAAAPAATTGGPDDRYQRTGWNGLVAAGLVQAWSVAQGEVETRFRGSAGAGRDAEGMIRPQVAAFDAWLSWVALPQAGRNLLEPARWREVRAQRESGQAVLLVLAGGRHPLLAPAEAPTRPRGAELVLRQGGQTFTLKPLPATAGLRLSGQHSGVAGDAVARYYTVQAAADGGRVDIEQAVSLELALWRRTGDAPEAVARVTFTREFAVPDAAAYRAQRETPRWLEAWAQRSTDLLLLSFALAVLVALLLAQRRLVARPGRLAWVRRAYLLFTLVWLGGVAQGQLTIVSLTSLIEALAAGGNAAFLLADPVAVVLWAFTGVTLLVWGRGTFCGWLCPFGALQELLAVAARTLGVAQRRLRQRTDAALKPIKYAVLALLVGASFTSAAWTERLVEVEPFKTSISLHFQREWPYVLFALACVLLGTLVHRGYCRYVCPLGAALALLGRVRLLRWIPRRAQCGTPCQTCRHGCDYQAIDVDGQVDYGECFQCLDCVDIHDDARRCLPLVMARQGRVVPIRVVAASPGARP